MPFARTWTEELVWEWMQLEGYLVELGVVTMPTPRGGRYEPDIVGARVRDGKLQIQHCEVAAWIGVNPTKASARYAAKFSLELAAKVASHFSRLFGVSLRDNECYEKWIIACDFSKPVEETLRKAIPDLQIYKVHELILKRVLPSVRQWRKDGRTKRGAEPTLPTGMWLLQLLDYLDSRQLLKPEGCPPPEMSRPFLRQLTRQPGRPS